MVLFAGGTVSPMMFHTGGQQKGDEKGGTEERESKTRAKTESQNKL